MTTKKSPILPILLIGGGIALGAILLSKKSSATADTTCPDCTLTCSEIPPCPVCPAVGDCPPCTNTCPECPICSNVCPSCPPCEACPDCNAVCNVTGGVGNFVDIRDPNVEIVGNSISLVDGNSGIVPLWTTGTGKRLFVTDIVLSVSVMAGGTGATRKNFVRIELNGNNPISFEVSARAQAASNEASASDSSELHIPLETPYPMSAGQTIVSNSFIGDDGKGMVTFVGWEEPV